MPDILEGTYIIDGNVVITDVGFVTTHRPEATVVAVSENNAATYINRQESEALWPMRGDIVEFDGAQYISKINYNVWTPIEYRLGWTSLEAQENGDWASDISVSVGEIYKYKGNDYVAMIGHTTQIGWEPPNVPALFKVIREAQSEEEWTSGMSYLVGDKVTYQGVAYVCLQAHTAIAGWQPPNVPALWSAV